MKYLLAAAVATTLLISAKGVAYGDTTEGRLAPKGIYGPVPGSAETCTLDAGKKVGIAVSDPGTVIVFNNGNGYARFTLTCE